MSAHLKAMLLGLLLAPAIVGQNVLAGDDTVTTIGTYFPVTRPPLAPGAPALSIANPFPLVAAKYMRLRFHVANPVAADWTIVVRDTSHKVVTVIENGPACETASGCWTGRIERDGLLVELYSAGAVTAGVTDGVLMPFFPNANYFSVYEDRPYVDLHTGIIPGDADADARKRRLGDNVGMFVTSNIGTAGDNVTWCCSGFLATRDLFVTNWHCGAAKGHLDQAYWQSGDDDHASCRNGFVDFSWDGDDARREFACRRVELADKTLDYAVLRLGPLSGGAAAPELGPLPKISTAPPAAGDELMTIHHANCGFKSISLDCSVVDASYPSWVDPGRMTEIAHNCSTENASSGAPMFRVGTTEVIALHHKGFAPDDELNKAVPMDAIVNSIEATAPQLYQEIIGQQ